jgi:hypothetical protein
MRRLSDLQVERGVRRVDLQGSGTLAVVIGRNAFGNPLADVGLDDYLCVPTIPGVPHYRADAS